MQMLAGIAVAVGLLLSIFNWATAFLSRPDRNVSPVPLLGGVVLAVGLLGFELTRPYWWLAAFIDFGTLMLLIALPSILYEMWAYSDRNAVHIFTHTQGDRTVEIKLFNSGDASIGISFDPPRLHGDRGDRAVSIGFSAKWHQNGDDFNLTDYAGGRELSLQPATDDFTATETCPGGDDPDIYGLDGITVEQQRPGQDEPT